MREALGLELSSRIYAYSACIGVVTGLAAVLFTYGLELAKYVCVEILSGHRQLRPEGAVRFDFSFAGTPSYADPHTWLLVLLPAAGG